MRRALLAAVLAAALAASLGACKGSTSGSPAPTQPSGPDTTTTEPASSEPTTTTTTSTTTTTTTTSTSSSKPPNPAPPPAPGGFPSPGNTGVPAGTAFRNTVGDYTASTPGQVIDGWHVQGSIVVKAAGVVIRNSQIDDSVWNEGGGAFTITDSTVGPATCGGHVTMPDGVGDHNYTAVRVRIRGHEDGFRASSSGIVIKDSYYQACVRDAQSDADGVQDYPVAPNIVLEHNTFDMGNITFGYTAPISVHATSANGARIVNNLAIGGTYSLNLNPGVGAWVVTGNRVVAGEYDFGAYEAEGKCGAIATWSDNDIVKIDSSYRIVATVVDNAPCGK